MHFSLIEAWLRESPQIDANPHRPLASISFIELWAPIALGASAVLASNFADSPSATVLADLRDHLILQLSQVGEAAVWEHFNSRRTLDALVKAHLDADERGFRTTVYCRVLEALRADGLRALTREYPVLRRHLCATVASWLDASRELLVASRRDHELLAKTFNFPVAARLSGVKPGLSDPHRGGRSVAILTFAADSASAVAVVFKPRDLRITAAYHQLVMDLSSAAPDNPPLRSLTVLPLDGYGYIEFVAHKICSNDKELANFYYNAGRLTAILYVLGCNDCHNENVIAERDQLVLVDAETLLQAMPRRAFADSQPAPARDVLQRRLADSVARIGLLPHWFFVAGDRMARDVSALGIEAPAAENDTYKGWTGLNTDGMVVGPATRSARLATSLPVGVGSPNRLREFKSNYCAGFRSQLQSIVANRRLWLGEAGCLQRFSDLRSRFVRRPTWVYLWMRGQILEPAAMRDEAAQLEAIMRVTAPKQSDILDDAVLTAERTQLGQLDVPYFEHAVVERDLLIDDADAATDFFAETGLDAARRRVASLDDKDIAMQLTIVEGLIAAKTRLAHRARRGERSMSRFAGGAPTAKERFTAAAAVGDLLASASIGDGQGNVDWLGIDSAADFERSCYGPIGPTLYSGTSGIALFLAALANAEWDQPANIRRGLVVSACADLTRIFESTDAVEKWKWWRDQPLGLAGSGGQLLAALLLRRMVPELRPAVDNGLAALLNALDPAVVRADPDLDIVFGCSGLIGPLLRIGTPKAVELALIAGDQLVARQNLHGGWITRAGGPVALTGFSHGASGAAAALAKLAATDGRGIYRDAAKLALGYERAQYDARENNWPDYRIGLSAAEPRFMLSWCHGAPGIALARLCLKSTPLWDDEAAQDLKLALAASTDATRLDDSLWLAVVLAARQYCAPRTHAASPDLGLSQAERLEAQALAEIGAEGSYRFGDAIGLFQGAAGIGLQLLDTLPHTRSTLAPQVLSACLID